MNLTREENTHLVMITDALNRLNRLTRVSRKNLAFRVFTTDDSDPPIVCVHAYRPDNQLDCIALGKR